MSQPKNVYGARYKGHSTEDPLIKYVCDHSLKLHPTQVKLIERTIALPMHFMLGAPEEMQLFQNLLRLMNAKRTLDIGTFTGFSALSLALALPDDGKVVSIDKTEEFAKQVNTFQLWKEAGVSHKIDFRLDDADKSLENILQTDGENSFDFAFIDADKLNYDIYYEFAVKLVRPGGIVAIDNTLWHRLVIDPENHAPETEVIRALNKKIANDTRVSVSFLTMADGVTLCFKK